MGPADSGRRPSRSDGAAAIAEHSRRLRTSVIGLAVFFALLVALLLAVPGLRSAAERVSDADPTWVAAGALLEVLSCVGYVVLFGLVFGALGWRLVSRLSLAELAVNSAFSLSGLGGLALGAWVLRSKGVSAAGVARGSALIFVLTSAVNVGAVVVIGVPMWLGLLPGSRSWKLTLLPAAAALAAILATLLLAARARRAGAGGRVRAGARAHTGRFAPALRALSGGVADAVRLIPRG